MTLAEAISKYVNFYRLPSPALAVVEGELADAIEHRMQDSRVENLKLATVLVDFLIAYRAGTSGDLGYAGKKVFDYFH